MSSQMLKFLFIRMIRNLCCENSGIYLFIYLGVAYVFQPYFDDDFFLPRTSISLLVKAQGLQDFFVLF